MLELHIWGQALGLPSIDPECIAAVTYLERILPDDQWTLVHQQHILNNDGIALPVLYHDNKRISRFPAIRSHLAKLGYSLDQDLAPAQKAKSIAITAHLAHNLLPILDETLYADTNNYSVIRSQWTHILPGHANFIHTPHRHAAASLRAVRAGLSASKAEPLEPSQSAAERAQAQAQGEFEDGSPSLLFRRKQTLQQEIARNQLKVRFRAEELIAEALKPLETYLQLSVGLVSKNSYTSVDYLIYGYLSLLTASQLADRFVADCIAVEHLTIAKYLSDLKAEIGKNSYLKAELHVSKPTSIQTVGNIGNEVLSAFFDPPLKYFLADGFCMGVANPSFRERWRRLLSPPASVAVLSPVVTAGLFAVYLWSNSIYSGTKMVFGRDRSAFAAMGSIGNAIWSLGSG